MKTSLRLLLVALLFAAVVGGETRGADFRVPADDGWYTWQVEAPDGSELQVFALMESGKPVKLRARGHSVCYSGFDAEAIDLGRVAADQSASWLHGHIYPVSSLSTDAILLIALHAGELPVEILEQLLAVAD
jgi:hypothetical protein